LVFGVGLLIGHHVFTPVRKADADVVGSDDGSPTSASAFMAGRWVTDGLRRDGPDYMLFQDTSIDLFVGGSRIKSVPIFGYRFVGGRLMIVTAPVSEAYPVAFGIFVKTITPNEILFDEGGTDPAIDDATWRKLSEISHGQIGKFLVDNVTASIPKGVRVERCVNG
jgi:hypothetical protein